MTAGVAILGKGSPERLQRMGKRSEGRKRKRKDRVAVGRIPRIRHRGEWGDSISRCKLKDEEMNKKRSGGSHADGLESTPSLREDSSGTKSLEALEKCGVLANIVYGQQV